jgi:predicted nuclease of predicted toxin-antitoxin system
MRFKIDENLPIEVAELLRDAGYDAMTVADQGLSGKPDQMIAEVVRAEKRTLVTLDLDFADIRSFPPGQYSGLVVLRPVLQDISSVLELIGRLVPLLGSEPIEGMLWVVDHTAVRIRGEST